MLQSLWVGHFELFHSSKQIANLKSFYNKGHAINFENNVSYSATAISFDVSFSIHEHFEKWFDEQNVAFFFLCTKPQRTLTCYKSAWFER